MAGANIQIDYDDSNLQDALTRLLQHVQNPEPVMMEIAGYLHKRTRYHFDTEQGPDGIAWAPLAESTEKRKIAQGVPVNKILHGKSLHLRDTIFPFYSPDEAGVSTGLGTDAYAATHQFGDKRRNIEARPFLGIGEEDQREVLDILEEEILSAL